MLDGSSAFTRRGFVAASIYAASCLIAGGACAGALSGCSSGADSSSSSDQSGQYVSSYDWDNLVWDRKKLAYYEGDQLRSRWGIDVSEHQEDNINWSSVAAAGVEFVFVRVGNRGATEGTVGADEYFSQNAIQAHEAGIEVNAYFFSQAPNEDEARQEAIFTVESLHEAEQAGVSFSYIAYDHEAVEIEGARANDLSSEQFTANAIAFCEVVEQAGYKSMIYGNKRDIMRLTPEARADYPIWYAEYEVSNPSAQFDFAIWQYTNQGTVSGITAPVDLNLWLEPK